MNLIGLKFSIQKGDLSNQAEFSGNKKNIISIVGGFNPFEKHQSQSKSIVFPRIGLKINIFETTSQICCISIYVHI